MPPHGGKSVPASIYDLVRTVTPPSRHSLKRPRVLPTSVARLCRWRLDDSPKLPPPKRRKSVTGDAELFPQNAPAVPSDSAHSCLLQEALIPPKVTLQCLGGIEPCTTASIYHRNKVVPTTSTAGVFNPTVLFEGFQGVVYSVDHRTDGGKLQPAVMKEPKDQGICISDVCTSQREPGKPSSGDEQLWIVVPCQEDGDDSWFFLHNVAVGDKVLEIRATDSSASHLRMCERNGQDGQRWRIDAESRLVCKFRGTDGNQECCLDVCGNCDEAGANVMSYKYTEGDNQRWQLEKMPDVSGHVVRIVSRMAGRRVLTARSGDQVRQDTVRELGHLVRWCDDRGCVKLLKTIWFGGTPKGFVMERLGKQLGRGTGPGNQECVLRDVQEGKSAYTLRRAVLCLMPVAQFLQRLHSDGFTHNDLHDGNILLQLDGKCFKVIDLGSVRRADHWIDELGEAHDGHWSRSRDWRAFAVAFIQLLDPSGTQRSLWDLVGTNGKVVCEATGTTCSWAPPLDSKESTGELPPEVELLMNRGHWTGTDGHHLRAALRALFAPRVDGASVCMSMARILGWV